MHLLSRPSMLGGGRAPRRVGISSPRAPPAPRRHLFARSESIKKKKSRSDAAAAKGSKRALLRAGLAAALQELRLAPGWPRNRKRGDRRCAPVAAARAAGADDADEGPSCSASANDVPASRGGGSGGRGAGPGWALALVAVLALACVVALGRAPAVCCCTCAAWLCRSGVVLESRSQAGGGAARPRRSA
ncbi:hypothetical protein BS78_08G081700 [Paspalum vaginatum]|uniref:Uncharacterized protein n=1 Tax=Paspalum vaginatum TaxID=158149 RepID=A0A9W7X646_9POAL|nr:hypothetical protein BS78_K168500 [Paspalum vaginatum]KAJ1265514.1 hypothetical protein BS78_08G081700 [Paspalum vaginatum]